MFGLLASLLIRHRPCVGGSIAHQRAAAGSVAAGTLRGTCKPFSAVCLLFPVFEQLQPTYLEMGQFKTWPSPRNCERIGSYCSTMCGITGWLCLANSG